MEALADIPKAYTKKDFESDQLVRWCPGCGDYSILSAMTNALPQLGIPRENFVFVSGIGCAARFPYYMNTYGFHTIHGRGPAVATGVKLANPKLSVWEVQGDGDALAIGGNHFIHALRRNIDINILLFNNEIYGLTKGQYSPTSPTGLVTKSTPYGSVERPFHAAELVIGAQGTFFARTIDTNPKLMTEIFVHAAKHVGTSLVEVLQNCVIFNDDAHAEVTAKQNRDDFQLHVKHGQPLLFGKDNKKGIRLNGLKLEAVTIGEHGITENDILVHNAHEEDPTLHLMLARLEPPHFPMALGVIREVRAKTYDEAIAEERKQITENAKYHSVDDLLMSGETWEIK
ncbi:MAG TPA: 2-oxoacid:ferredoxin oxidoreductase subunit beta [Cyclobacteriaceae bacterium]|nr:2-oxoacid:ferredoxin oxidoreductase subunit beta [Cyclobacteriaceae bacterium]HRJ82228.1 2-oxoacid:ferredoxin oxidoreductase subunit beta [Cyclobacteriaceae bacterium]